MAMISAALVSLPALLARNNGPSKDEEAIIMMIAIGVTVVIVAAIIALWAFVLYVYYKALDVVPPQFRTMEPAHVFFLLIPCFNIVWIFFVVQRIPESFRNYFRAIGDNTRGDCGSGFGMTYAILMACASVPYVGALFGLPALILMILFLIKIWELRKAVEATKDKFGYASLGYGGAGYYAGDPHNPYAHPGGLPPKQ